MLNNLNSVLIEGVLMADPEVKFTPQGACTTTFSIQSNRFFMLNEERQKEVSFFDIVTFSRLAEVCGEYLKKNRGVRVVGRLKSEEVGTSPETAHTHVFIIAEHVEFKPVTKKEVKS